jgi:tousled-like kinase
MKSLEDRNGRLVKSLEDIHRKMAMQEFRRKRDQLALDCVRLGKIVTVRTGPTTMGDVWEEGYAMKELTKRSAELLSRKEELESRRKKIANTRRAITRKGQAAAAAAAAVAASSSFDADATLPFDPEVDVDMDLATEAEVIKSHLEQLRRDEIALAEERRMLEGEKAVHQKEIKRCQCEERSRFYRDLPTLHDRYLLQTMLGRGGFSEVWKALDLQELKEVAVKIHQLNPQWSEERKGSYIKHVTREYTIHRDMKHPRVVQLFDVFEIDMNSFATVLEYCRGIDLDEKLKRHKTLQEKDAKAIFMQILSGLRYLHHPYSYNASGLYLGPDGADNSTETATSSTTTTAASSSSGSSGAVSNNNVVHNTNSSTLIASSHGSGPGGNTGPTSTNNANNSHHQVPNHLKRLSVIHFDLKPANILFDEFGDVKITGKCACLYRRRGSAGH